MSPVQTNTQSGIVVRTAASDLSTKEGLFAVVSGSLGCDLAGAGALALYVISSGGASGKPVDLIPLSSSRNVRVISAATIAAGVQIASDASGKLRTAITNDNVLGITEESTVAGQYTLIRPAKLGVHA